MIYADHAASTPCLPEVVAAVSQCLREDWANPGSRQHAPGRRAQGLVDAARAEVAALIGARPDEVVFTSGATESCNLALFGVGERLLPERPRFVTIASEHAAVLAPLERLAAAGAEVIRIGVDREGRLDRTAFAAACAASCAGQAGRTALVAVMLVNNETGVVQDLAAAAATAHAAGALLLCDATQGLGRMPVDVTALGCDLLALSGHKFGAPSGIGALWLRRGLGLSAQIHGGGQERGLRSGTPNLPGIVGLGVAARLAHERLAGKVERLTALTARLEGAVRDALPGALVAGAGAVRAPGISFFVHPGLAVGWLGQLATVAASAGASCALARREPSHVLTAMGFPEDQAGNAIRISLGSTTTEAEVDAIAAALAAGALALGGRSLA